MKRHIIFIVALASLLFSSCNKASKGEFWGKTKYYSDFLFCKYKPVIMEQMLEFEFNEDAQLFVKDDIEFEMVERDATGELVRIKENEILLHKNGVKCESNILKVNTSENEVLLGIEFTQNARKGYHTLYLREKDEIGLDRIDYQELTGGICVVKKDVMNPLKKVLLWVLAVVVAMLIIWRIFIRPLMFESFKVRILYFFYPEMKSLKVKGYIKVVCSRRKQKQSFINQFLTGKIAFVQNEFWDQDIEIIPRDRRTVRVRPPRGFTVSPSSTVPIGTDAEIINTNTNQIVKLKIN